MSNVTISDGTGNSFRARVTSHNHLSTIAITESIAAHHGFEGDAYNINTGTITLTSDSESAVLYLKNNENYDIVVQALIYLIGASTGGSGNTSIDIERNPTGGTIVSGASAATPVNRNFGSANTLTVDSYKGAEGNTLTGSDGEVIKSILSSSGRYVISDAGIILPKGTSIGVNITPPSSNTSMEIQIAMSIYRATETTGE